MVQLTSCWKHFMLEMTYGLSLIRLSEGALAHPDEEVIDAVHVQVLGYF